MRSTRILTILAIIGVTMASVGCGPKKIAKADTPTVNPPPPAPVQPKPSISFTAEPSSITRGESVTLRWSAQNATAISIEPGISTVAASGSRQAFPGSSTTYVISATGPGGTVTASASVSVSAAVATPKVTATDKTPTDLLNSLVDTFFDYDKSEVRADARAILQKNAEVLREAFKAHPDEVVQIEGHADERGSAEYNLGLGDRRAASAKEFLVQLGIPVNRLKVVTYGKERPQCTDQSEDCWQKNRRAHFAKGQ